MQCAARHAWRVRVSGRPITRRSTVRIGPWNLYLRANSPTEGWASEADWLHEQHADLWLLTEVSTQWKPRNGQFIDSSRRCIRHDQLRWAAIETTLPNLGSRTTGDPEHPGEQGLALARIVVDGRSVLLACSVLPYEGGAAGLGRLSGGQKEQFHLVLWHHVSRISAERYSDEEPLIRGGDVNQELMRPYAHGLASGADELRSALEALGLTALTAGMADRDHLGHTIDHLALSSHFMAERVEVHRPERAGERLGDHAAYTAVVNLIAT